MNVPGYTVTCEVCGTPQPPASVCATCGLGLKVPPGVLLVGDPIVERMPDLEPTRFDPVEVSALPMPPDVERGREAPVAEVAMARPSGFEPTESLELVPDVDAGTLPGLEPTTDEFEKTVGPEALTPLDCPYCGHRQFEGRICDRCGRARARVLPSARREVDTVLCHACGARVLPAALCSDCGEPLPGLD